MNKRIFFFFFTDYLLKFKIVKDSVMNDVKLEKFYLNNIMKLKKENKLC